MATQTPLTPFEIYRRLDLGPGGYANRPATESRQGAREAILIKHGRGYRDLAVENPD